MKRLKLGSVAALLGLLALVASAQSNWNPLKPEASSPTRQSAEIRENWRALARGIGAVNLVADNGFVLWGAGDTAAPTLHALSGTGATIARTGVGLADTEHKFGDFAAKVTAGIGVNATLAQVMFADLSLVDALLTLDVSCGAWVNAKTVGTARIIAQAGFGAVQSESHTGTGTWQWLTTRVQVNDSNGPLRMYLEVDAPNSVAYISGPTCVIGSVPPSYPQPSGWESFEFDLCFRAGAQTTGTDKVECHKQSPFYGIVQGVSLRAGTAPATNPLIFDVNTWDGAAYTSMFTSGGRPQIAVGATRSVAAPPDSTYARAIIVPQHGTTQAVGGELSLDVDQIGTLPAGSDVRVSVRGIRVARPLQQFLLATE